VKAHRAGRRRTFGVGPRFARVATVGFCVRIGSVKREWIAEILTGEEIFARHIRNDKAHATC
jgi:hypothetical protein